jgi:glutathione S-transferase
MPELELIGGPQSNYVWTCRIALAEKGVPYTLTATMPHTPVADATHPLGKIPSMRHGDLTLAESRAICLYIDRAFSGPPLVPADAVAAAQAEQWISIINTAIQPAVSQYLSGYFFPGTSDGSPNRVRIAEALPKVEPHFALLGRTVAKTGYLAAGTFTLADMTMMPMLYYLSKVPESAAMLNRSASLKTYFERHLARASVRQTVPPPLRQHAHLLDETHRPSP